MNVTWVNLMDDFFGVRISDEKANRWVYLLQQNDALGEDLTEEDLVETLKWVRKQREGDQYRKQPTLETLIGWVKWWRKEQAAWRRGNEPITGIGRIKAAMLRARDTAERWEILCESKADFAIMQELDRWAEQRWPAYVGERDEIKRNIAASLREAISNIGLIA